MKLAIDISVFIGTTASWGHVNGTLEFAAVPAVGATISLMGTPPVPRGFIPRLKVESVMFRPVNGDETGIILFLEDLVLESTEQADAVAEYLERSLGLFANNHAQDEKT